MNVSRDPVDNSRIVFLQFIFSEGFTVSRDTAIQIMSDTIVRMINNVITTPLYFIYTIVSAIYGKLYLFFMIFLQAERNVEILI